jgi:hypothetical protein
MQMNKRMGTVLVSAGLALAAISSGVAAPSAGAAAPVATATTAVAPTAREARQGYYYNYYWSIDGCFSMGSYGVSVGMWYGYICQTFQSQYPGQYVYGLYVY